MKIISIIKSFVQKVVLPLLLDTTEVKEIEKVEIIKEINSKVNEKEKDFVEVLDKGYVKLVRVDGSEDSIVDSARVSYMRHDQIRDPLKDEKLLEFLMNKNHTSPFEMSRVQFQIKLPLYIASQFGRYRTASMNQESLRYTEVTEEKNDFYVPAKERLQKQCNSNKQSSTGTLDDIAGSLSLTEYVKSVEESYRVYKLLLSKGLCREVARGVLPNCTYTTIMFYVDINNLFKILTQRLGSGAQFEIRMYAQAMLSLVRPYFPRICVQFDRVLDAQKFTDDILSEEYDNKWKKKA